MICEICKHKINKKIELDNNMINICFNCFHKEIEKGTIELNKIYEIPIHQIKIKIEVDNDD